MPNRRAERSRPPSGAFLVEEKGIRAANPACGVGKTAPQVERRKGLVAACGEKVEDAPEISSESATDREDAPALPEKSAPVVGETSPKERNSLSAEKEFAQVVEDNAMPNRREERSCPPSGAFLVEEKGIRAANQTCGVGKTAPQVERQKGLVAACGGKVEDAPQILPEDAADREDAPALPEKSAPVVGEASPKERNSLSAEKEFAQVVEDNLGLVHLCARRFVGRGVEYDDLFQAGCVGLVKAAENFDPQRGVRFSTYAVPVILGEVRRLFRDGGAVRVSRGLHELARRVRTAAEEISNATGQSATVDQIAQALEIAPEKAALALGALNRPVSLTVGEEESQLEIPVEAPEERVTERLTLRGIIDGMEERDKKLIYYRYYKSMTQTQTAQLLGMTQVQVSRREKRLLAYMREQFG